MKIFFKFILISFLLSAAGFYLFSQFSIHPTLEITICIDGKVNNLPSYIYLNGKSKKYLINVNKNHDIIYDIEPGTYNIEYLSNNQIVHVLYEIKFLFDPISMQEFEKRSILNVFKINEHKNFKLEIDIVAGLDQSFIEKNTSSVYKNYDSQKFTYYISQNQTYAYNYCNDTKYFSQHSGPNVLFEMSSDSGDTSNNTCERTENVAINKQCTIGDGAANINIKNANLCFDKMTIYNSERDDKTDKIKLNKKGSVGGKDDDGPDGQWVNGKILLEGLKAIPKNITSTCVNGKCHTTFDVDLNLRFSFTVWNNKDLCEAESNTGRNEMCQGKEVYFSFNNPDNCNCQYKAVIEHEKKHEELWVDYMQKFKDMTCDHIFQNTQPMSCICPNDNDEYCKTYDVKNLVDAIENALAEIYNVEMGKVQDIKCYEIERKSFIRCACKRL